MKLEGKRILVTGGAGFIGSHVCEKLLKQGAEVTVLDDFSTGKPNNLKNIKNHVRIVKGNVDNYHDVVKAVADCSFVIHEAFPYGKAGRGLKEQYVETGALGTFNVLKASVENKVEKVTYASTVAIYGIPKYLPVDEKHPADPFLPYGATKYVGELYCSTFSKLYGLDTVSLRYFYVYGPRYAQFDHSALVIFLHRAMKNQPLIIFGDGSQIRDYTYIDDAVEGTLLALKKVDTKGEAYNISSGKKITILDLAKHVVEITGKKIEIKFAENNEYRFGDKYCSVPTGLTKKIGDKWIDERNYISDISKAKRELGYNPKISLEEGIQRTYDWLCTLKE